MPTIPNAPLGENTSPATTVKIPVSGSKYVQIANLLKNYAAPVQGDILYHNGTNWVALVAGTSGHYLKTQGAGANPVWAATSVSKGRVEILGANVPTTVGAPIAFLAGASSPAESIPYYAYVNGSVTYIELHCRLLDYASGGLTVNFGVMRTTGAAAETYIFEAAIRRINTATEDLGAAHTYDYNAVTVTIPAGPPTATIPMAGTITFTDGADMDSLATGEQFILRLRRNGGTATDTARLLVGVTIKET